MKKKIFLVFKKKDYFYRYCNNEETQCKQVFSEGKCKFILAHILKKIGLPIPKMLIGPWLYNINDYGLVVFSDYAYTPDVYRLIKRYNTKCRICFYYMNDVEVEGDKYSYLKIENVKRVFDKNNIFTYSLSDSQKYDITYIPTMYKADEKYVLPKKMETDIIYLGADKNRGSDIEKIYRILSNTLKLNFKVFDNHSEIGINKTIDYLQYLHELWDSKAVLDIVKNEKNAVSLRALEALFYNKKLITNNKGIQLLDIYEAICENVYFIDCNNINVEEICKFMNKPIKNSMVYKSIYEFEKWLEKF